MPKYMSVSQSVPSSACLPLPGCLPVRCHPVWSAARPCQNFHLQSTRPTHKHTHTVLLRGAYDIQIRQGAIPSPKHPTQCPFCCPFPLLLLHFPEPELCLRQLPSTGGYTCATMCLYVRVCVCVWRNFLIYFLANGSRPSPFQVRALPAPNKLLMEISKYWFSVKTFASLLFLSLSLSHFLDSQLTFELYKFGRECDDDD